MARKLTLLLALAMLLSIFAYSCDTKGNVKNVTNTTAGGGGGDDDNGLGKYKEINADGKEVWKITAPVYDGGGYTLNILHRSGGGENNQYGDVDFTYKEADDGEPINDAAYRRRVEIEEMYGIKINMILAGNDQHVTRVRNSVSAGDNAFDITFNCFFDQGTLSREGLLYDLFEFPNIDLTEPWWDKNMIDSASIGTKIYHAAGDISIHYKKTFTCVFFNKQMLTDLGLESPYKLVEDNQWTIPKVIELCKPVWDLNPEGALQSGKLDYYVGMTGYTGTLAQLFTGSMIMLSAKNEDNIPELAFYSEKSLDAYETIKELMHDRTLFYNFQLGPMTGRDGRTKFVNNETLFLIVEASYMQVLRAMDTDFGVVPVPKLNPEQPRFSTHLNTRESQTLSIPVGNKSYEELEFVGAVVSALATMGKNYLTPAFYEVSLKGKLTRDEDSEGMLDIIFNNVSMDAVRMYNIGKANDAVNNMSSGLVADFASWWARQEPVFQTDLDKMIDDYMALE